MTSTITRRHALSSVAALAAGALAPGVAVDATPLDDLAAEDFTALVATLCAEDRAEYDATWRAAIAFDPSYTTFLHPVTLLDEAAIGLYLTAFDKGYAYALATRTAA